MSTQLDDPIYNIDEAFFQQNLPQYYRAILRNFRSIALGFVNFHLLFLLLLACESTLCIAFFPFLNHSAVMAFAMTAVFLTLFAYLLLLFYFSTKKPEQLVQLRDGFVQSCRHAIGMPQGESQHHLNIAAALTKLAFYLDDFERTFYQVPKFLLPLHSLITKLSAFLYWKDVFKLKQLLLQTAIEEHLLQIRITPIDLEVHASLGNTYVALSKLYLPPAEEHPSENHYHKNQDIFEKKFAEAAHLAIEEFQILNHYAPNDPWIHEQLAAGYRDLKLPLEEIKEVETLLRLRPQDKDILFRLGTLYFEQGCNAKGLTIYEELKKANFKKAGDLISTYGANNFF